MTHSNDDMKTTLNMTADTVGKDLLQALVQEMKLLPDLWVKLSQKKQDDVIERLRKRVETNVKMAVHLLASEGRTVVVADLESITRKDGIKAIFKINSNSEGRHELFDSEGQACLIVVADATEHTSGMDKVRGESDQRAMDLGHEYDPSGDGKGMDNDDDEVTDVKPLTIELQPLEAELQQAYEEGYQAASKGQSQTDCPIMGGALCIEWVKGWKAWQEEHGEGHNDGLGGEAA